MVGAKGFEPSTSWSRTGVSENLKFCWCRTYGLITLQNLRSIGPHGTQSNVKDTRSRRSRYLLMSSFASRRFKRG